MVKYLILKIFISRFFSFLYLGGYPSLTLTDFLSNIWTYLMQTSPCRLLNTMRYFLMNKFILMDYFQRPSSYKQISRII